MQKPSSQFVDKLEKELRLAYKAEFPAQKPAVSHKFNPFFKFFLPAFSGIVVVALIVLNLKGSFLSTPAPDQLGQELTSSSDQRFESFNEAGQEAQIAQDFDNDELNQIDANVRHVADDNY